MVKVTRVGILFLAFFLSACQTLSNTPDKRESTNSNTHTSNKTEQQKTQTQPAKVDEVINASPAVDSLLIQATQQEQAGNTRAAINTLERAIRIAPRYPTSYYRLAKLRYQQGNYQQAASLAQKALSLGAAGELREQSLLIISNVSK